LEFVDAISEVEDRRSEIEGSGSEIRVPAINNDIVCEEWHFDWGSKLRYFEHVEVEVLPCGTPRKSVRCTG